jgi:hypothetical protein
LHGLPILGVLGRREVGFRLEVRIVGGHVSLQSMRFCDEDSSQAEDGNSAPRSGGWW